MDKFSDLTSKLYGNRYNGTVLISRNQKIIYEEAFGFKDSKLLQKMEPSTPMRIASVTKMVTAVGILKLVEYKKIDLNDRIQKFLVGFKHDITIHQLLSNSAGIANFDINMDFSKILAQKNILEALIDIFKDEPLKFNPGERFGYSVSGFLILQYIIEKVSSMKYIEFLKNEIFDELGMSMTYFDTPNIEIKGRAEPLELRNGVIVDAPLIDMRIAGGGGGLVSNIYDLYKLNCALINYKILPKELVNKLFGNNIKITENDYYGYGMVLNSSTMFGRNMRKYYHPGGGNGVRAFNTIYPDDNIQVILLSNLNDKEIFNESRLEIDKFIFEEKE